MDKWIQRANLEIVREISWGRLVIDSGTRTGLIVIPDASMQGGITRIRGRGSRTIGRWWDWILTHDDDGRTVSSKSRRSSTLNKDSRPAESDVIFTRCLLSIRDRPPFGVLVATIVDVSCVA